MKGRGVAVGADGLATCNRFGVGLGGTLARSSPSPGPRISNAERAQMPRITTMAMIIMDPRPPGNGTLPEGHVGLGRAVVGTGGRGGAAPP